jgi:hypothetical protein
MRFAIAPCRIHFLPARTRLASNPTARVFFFVQEERIGIAHGLIKKTRIAMNAREAIMQRVIVSPSWGRSVRAFKTK